MTTVILSPRVLGTAAGTVPLRAPNYKPGAVFGVFWAVAVFALVIAIVAAEPGFRIMMGSLALLLGVAAPVMVRWTESISERRVQIDASQPQLRFVVSRGTTALFSVLAIIGILPAAAMLALPLLGVPALTGSVAMRWAPYVLGALGLVWLAQQLWSLRTPRGLTLSASGLTGVRGAASVDLRWDDLAGASVSPERGAKLVLTRAGASPIVIEPRWTGSDPNIVAAIIEHYRRYPADRALLADPRAAIRRVEDATAGS